MDLFCLQDVVNVHEPVEDAWHICGCVKYNVMGESSINLALRPGSVRKAVKTRCLFDSQANDEPIGYLKVLYY